MNKLGSAFIKYIYKVMYKFTRRAIYFDTVMELVAP